MRHGLLVMAILLFMLAAAASPASAAGLEKVEAWSKQVRGVVLSTAVGGQGYVVVGTGWGDGLAYGAVYVFKASSGDLVWYNATEGGVSSVAVTASGCFAAATVDGIVYIKCPGEAPVKVNVSNLYPRLSMRVYWPLVAAGDTVVTEYAVTSLKLTGSGELFEFGVEGLSVSGSVLWSFNTSNFVTALAASPNGTLVAAGDYSGYLYIYNTETGALTTVRLWHPVHSLVFSGDSVYAYTYDGLLYRVSLDGRVEASRTLEGAAAPGRLLARMGGYVVVGTAKVGYLLDELNATKYIDLVSGGSGAVYAVAGGSVAWGRGVGAVYWVSGSPDYVAVVGGVGGPSGGFNATVELFNATGSLVLNKTLPGRLVLSASLLESSPSLVLLVYGDSPYQSLDCNSTVHAVLVYRPSTVTATATTTSSPAAGPAIPVSLGVVALVVLLVVIVFIVLPLWLQSHH